MPISNDIGNAYMYQEMVAKIVATIKEVCDQYQCPHPHIFTEF
jgi:arginine decarboxylase-like protein